ncbi:MAG: ParB/RepB/Spo0J family partition protein [Planctomycetes bacterium]|nr:ParB/RepB/Spo0J family partition protein [Planctomycetota bacterium]
MNSKSTKKHTYKKVLLRLIDPPQKADRLEISAQAVEELADSISEIGLMSPILLAVSGDRFEIVFGDRRFRAVEKLGWKDIMASVKEMSPKEVSIARATENIQRENLSIYEEALVYARLVKDLGMTLDQVASKTGKSAGVIKRRMQVLRMPTSFQEALHSGKISAGVAEELWSCSDEAHRDYLLLMAVEHGITVAVARQWVQEHRKEQRNSGPTVELGGLDQGASFDEKIYRSCQACRGPVELSLLKELRMCPDCYHKVVEAIKG